MTKNIISTNPSFQEAAAVCLAIHGEDTAFTVKLLKRPAVGKAVDTASYFHGYLADHVEQFPKWMSQGIEPFLMVGATFGTGIGTGADSVGSTWALAVDLDYDVDMARWESSPFKPTLAINTSGQRQHFIWVLDHWIDNETARQNLIALAHRLGGDPCFAHAAQAVRLPGFVNQKHGNNVTVSLIDSARTYDPVKLALAFDVRLVAASLRARIPKLTSSLVLRKADVSEDHLIEDLQTALPYISSDHYDDWVKVTAALSTLGEAGYPLADDWSRGSDKYDAKTMASTWKSFSNGSRGLSAGPASVFYMAARNGWSNPGYRNTKAARMPLTERSAGRMLAAAMYPDIAASRIGHGDKQRLQPHRWDGVKFAALDKYQFRTCVEEYVQRLLDKSDDPGSKGHVAAIAKFTGESRALDSLGEHALEFLVEQSDMVDATKYPYLAVANGVVNLLSGELLPSTMRPVARRRSGIVFDASAKAPLFEKFLREIFQNDEDLCRFFLRLAGYILLGRPIEHHLIVLFGPLGRNGKSVAVDVLMAIFGEFACTLPVATVMVKGTMTDGATPALARLEGRRLAVINEPNQKHQIDSGLVKQLTGGDRISARPLYGSEVEFESEATPIMVTNVLPKIHENDEALWRRLLIIPFERTFTDDEIDPDLKEKLLREVSGILNLIVAGAVDYQQNGLQPPSTVRATATEQRKLADPMEAWIAERTVPSSHESVFSSLLADYRAWAKENVEFTKLSSREFSKALDKRFQRVVRRNYVFFDGLSLKESPLA